MKSTDISLDRQASSDKKTIIIMKSTDISLDRQASSDKKTIIIMKSTDISLDRQASSANEACRSSEISVDFIIIIVFL